MFETLDMALVSADFTKEEDLLTAFFSFSVVSLEEDFASSTLSGVTFFLRIHEVNMSLGRDDFNV